MPRETLRALDADVERLLQAGAAAAAADAALAQRKDALAGFAAKVPALAKVAEQVGKVAGARARDAAPELLNLAALVVQLRGAQAAPAKRDGELRPVPAAERIETPLAPFQYEPIREALKGGSGREDVITDAVERGLVRDLRLFSAWLDALANSGIGDVVAEEVLPTFGLAIVPHVAPQMKLDGKAVDARRLKCLVKVQGPDALPLVRRAVEEGSAHLRCAGIAALQQLAPSEAHDVALRLASRDKSKDVREAGVDVLAEHPTDASLDALLAALRDGASEVRRAAVRALRNVQHPQATARLLALLTPDALDIKPYVPPKKKRGAKLTPAMQKAAQKAEQEAMKAVNEKVERVADVLRAVGGRKDPSSKARLLELWKTHAMSEVRSAAGHALVDWDDAEVREALCVGLGHDDYDVRDIAHQAFFHDEATVFDRAQPYLAHLELPPKDKRRQVAEEILEELSYRDELKADPRWKDFFFAKLDTTDKGVRYHALDYLLHAKDERALDRLPAFIAKDQVDRWTLLDALSEWKHPKIPPIVVARLGDKKWNWWQLLEVVKHNDDPGVVPALEARAEKIKKRKSDKGEFDKITEVVSYLKRDRTLS